MSNYVKIHGNDEKYEIEGGIMRALVIRHFDVRYG